VFGLALAIVVSGAAWIILRLQLSARALGVATADLRAANAKLEAEQQKTRELADLKSQFVSMTSHEFRTPLSAILSSAELLEAYGERWSAHKKGEHLARVKDAARRMKEMLDDVLLVGKADAGMLEFKPRPVDLDAWAAELVDRNNEEHEPTHSVVYSSSGDLDVVVDDRLLGHVIANLLSNAIKYSPRGGTVKLDVRRAEDHVELEVTDEGIGIPESDQLNLFETFHRGKNVGNVPGTGLGLAIDKRALDVQGGRIEVDSELGRGTRFVVSVPASADPRDA
jgi:signal transduction histidine kinase